MPPQYALALVCLLGLLLPSAVAQFRCSSIDCGGLDCCQTNEENPRCYNSSIETCAYCIGNNGGQFDYVLCGLGQGCCNQWCWDKAETQCCTAQPNGFMCTFNETCCGFFSGGSGCCPSDMTCNLHIAPGDCSGYPASPTCLQPCKEDSDCFAGGSRCTTCAVNNLGMFGSEKVCTATIELPTTTTGTHAFSISAGEGVIFHYTTAGPDSVSALNLQLPRFPDDAYNNCLEVFAAGAMGVFMEGLLTNLNGTNIITGDFTEAVYFPDTHICSEPSGVVTYETSTTPYPTSNLWVSVGAQWQGSVTEGAMLTFPLNNNHTINALQQPFVVNITLGEGDSNCTLLPTLFFSSTLNGSAAMPVLAQASSGGAFYGFPITDASWLAVVYVVSGTCDVSVKASALPLIDFGTTFNFAIQRNTTYVACCGITSWSDGCVCYGESFFGTYTPPMESIASVYCLTAEISGRCSVALNGDFDTQTLTLPIGSSVRVDVYDSWSSGQISCSGSIIATAGPCPAAPQSLQEDKANVHIV